MENNDKNTFNLDGSSAADIINEYWKQYEKYDLFKPPTPAIPPVTKPKSSLAAGLVFFIWGAFIYLFPQGTDLQIGWLHWTFIGVGFLSLLFGVMLVIMGLFAHIEQAMAK